MAPGAIFETPNVAEDFNNHRDGSALEATSDMIDDVNVLKAALKVKNGTATQEEKDELDDAMRSLATLGL